MKNFTRILIATSLVVMIAFNSYSQDLFRNANVGIGTISPTQKLDVFGSIKFSVALMPNGNAGLAGNILLSGGPASFPTWLGNGSNGQLLMESTSGVPTWVSPSTALAAWSTIGNTLSPFTYGSYFIGTINNEPLEFYANNAYAGVIDPNYDNVYLGGGSGNDATSQTGAYYNVGIGWGTLASITSGEYYNTAIGYDALNSFHYYYNTAVGAYSLYSTNNSDYNTALGYSASYSQSSGTYNDAVGYDANYWNQSGSEDVALGDSAMYGGTGAVYTSSSFNTAIGVSALSGINSSSNYNTGVGYEVERHLVTGDYNTGIGAQTNYNLTTAYYTTGVGYQANYNLTTGYYNTGVGYQTNYSNKTGYGNVAVGANALYTNIYSGNTAIGTNALYKDNIGGVANGPNVAVGDSAMYLNVLGTKNVAVGYAALTIAGATGDANTANTAVGFEAMYNANGLTVANNVAVGSEALYNYEQASNDVAVGAFALYGAANNSTVVPTQDIAIGPFAMYNAGTGFTTTAASNDIAIGAGTSTTTGTLYGITSGSNDIAVGYESGVITALMTTGNYNTYLGYETYGATTQSQNTAIGATAHAGSTTASASSNDVAIGYAANAYGYTGTTNATAIGYSATATGTNSTAIGANSTAGNSGAATSATAIGPSSTASANNATAIGPNTTASTANTIILGDASYANTVNQVNVGIGTTAPARELEVAGSTNTIRVDGLASGGTFNASLSTNGSIVYINNSNGDLYSLPNGTTGQVLTLTGSNAPSWAVSSALPNATSPLVASGSNISLQGAAGTVLIGTGTGSVFFGAGEPGQVLEGLGAGTAPTWTTIAALAGTGDEWGSQVAITDSSNESPAGTPENTITGNGLSTSPLRLSRQGASNNEVLLWNTAANTWLPGSGNTSLTTNNILGGTAVVITNGTSQVVGSGNATVDVQGTAGAVLYGKGIGNSAVFSGAGVSGQVLTSSGTGAPTWTSLTTTGAWNTSGNAGTVPGTNFIGTTTDEGFDLEVNNANAGAIDPLNAGNSAANVYLGAASTALSGAGNNDAGDNNVALGLSALASAGGPSYVGNPAGALTGYITGNVAAGVYALASAKYGGDNTALGAFSQYNANWSSETSSGAVPASGGTINGNNTAVGAYSLYSNTSGQGNTSLGYYSTYGSGSAAALGNYNVAEGYKALYTASAGIASNTAVGSNALYNVAGSRNTAVGDSALYSTTGSNNTALGYQATATGAISNATAIGAFAVASTSNSIVLGQISGVGNGTVNTNVGIGTNTPDADAALAIKTLHLETQPAATNPSILPVTASLTGTDVGGVISFNVTSGGAAGTQVTVTFANNYTVPPTIIITAANAATGGIMGTYSPYVSNVTATGFTINFTNAPTASAALEFYYFAIETQ